ncbi:MULTISPECIES: 30S ribosomal protein S5 [Hymenobacter]|jgi:small subunit ribosomal protein S5|uniref:Small ribosomal subunit protein uS5 n=2 Tax=Hymenobacter TaxID=89966 RepID=A0A7K1TE49_9BACT|nr:MULTISPECIES: 30S ribosomal protein S5 [Hymenobacter]RZJ57711.1 MAG: 30S ribosomal protein S5 [Hymenobacter sp.]MDO7885098.1 30S ribosomal protein S5 [Hymenobacter sp. CA2-7]MVN76698.1 30S ribosomal protein S5 [Hymenobacter ginkgonis]QKG53724.1 30S ribosomal protein S5 [Hymenobacter sp. BRD67]TFZ65858.1 30S ribosomal protein S5 [Hymenobacter sp. UV11]
MAEYNNNNRGGAPGGNDRGGNNRGGNDRRGNDRGGRGNDSSVQGDSDFKEKVVAINRVAKVVKGGRRFSFSAIVVVGDGKGNVGYGLGKANEVTDAIAKGIDDARKNVVKVPLYKHTVPHVMEGRYGGGFVLVQPAAAGTGVIAGGAMRAVFESAGIKDVLAKSKGSSNPHNVVKATFAALAKMRDPMQIAQARGISLARVFNG